MIQTQDNMCTVASKTDIFFRLVPQVCRLECPMVGERANLWNRRLDDIPSRRVATTTFEQFAISGIARRSTCAASFLCEQLLF